jgi:hypothetical protein
MHHLYKSVVCPFYVTANNSSIRCEGYSEGTNLRLIFFDKEKMDCHTRRYCNNMKGFESCPLYPIIMKQYEEGKDE